MKNFLKKYFLGLTLKEEYICLSYENIEKPMKIYLQLQDRSLIDISNSQVMLGYKPLIIGICKNLLLDDIQLLNIKEIKLHFGISENEITAKLNMSVLKVENLNFKSVVLLIGNKGKHNFSPYFQKSFRNLHYKILAKKEKNIYLKGNLYDQVKIAYSFPRKIYLASLGENGFYNIFPTDISGKFNDEYFALSLRSKSKANKQLKKIGNCVIAEMHSDSCEKVYKLGRNHMKELEEVSSFDIELNTFRSKILNLILPKAATRYYELKSTDKKIEIGLHTVHFLKIINSEKLSDENSTLAHIHRDYAEWRLKNKIQTNFLIKGN